MESKGLAIVGLVVDICQLLATGILAVVIYKKADDLRDLATEKWQVVKKALPILEKLF